MTLLFEGENRKSIEQHLVKTRESVLYLSAFVKLNALKWLSDQLLHRPEILVTIVARWQPRDLVTGSSDISAYEYSKEQGWRFLLNNNMHYKICLVDDDFLSVGSANLTQRGLHIGIPGNDEASVQVTPTDIDIERLKKYVSGCCIVDDALFSEIHDAVEGFGGDLNSGIPIKWPQNILERMQPTTHLWVNDLLFCSPLKEYEQGNELVIHDSELLGTMKWESHSERTNILNSLRGTPVWQWLVRTVDDSENEFVRFGEITAKLHDFLLDDPKPYRKDVKELLSNLYEWIRFLEPEELGIRKFNHTETLFLR